MFLSCFVDVQLLCIDSTIIDTDNKIYMVEKKPELCRIIRKFFVKDAQAETL